jgi:hypothetical protein
VNGISLPSDVLAELDAPPRRNAELAREVPAKLVEDVNGGDEVVAHEAGLDQGLAEAARRERREQQVRVEEDPRETAWKTSSSARNPCASAKRSTRPRNARKRSTARERVSESRTISPAGRPRCFARRSSSRRISGERRVVSVAVT